MAVRIFISTYRANPGRNVNPALDWIEANLTSADIDFIWLCWPERDPANNGRPKKQMVITIVGGTTAIENIVNAENTDMLSAYDGNTLTDDIPNGVKNQQQATLNSHGFNESVFTEQTWQGCLVKMLQVVSPNDLCVQKMQGVIASELA